MAIGGRRRDRDGLFMGNVPHRAIIDVGSNTVRLVVYGGSPRAPTVLLNEKVAARLGRDITTTGALAEEAIDLAMRGLERYALLLRDLDIQEVDMVATAAARDASNGPEFLRKVEALGFSPHLLSGEEEGNISAWGVLGAFPKARGVVADLGGGSLELVHIGDGSPDTAISLPLGTLRLTELDEASPGKLHKVIQSRLKDAKAHRSIDGDLYLVGGTWRAMAVYAIEKLGFPLTDPHGLSLPAEEALAMAKELAESDPEDLRSMERISTMRSDTMPLAAVLLQVLIKKLRPDRVIASSWGIREGVLYQSLAPHARAQDPLIAGVSTFAASRGASPTMATRIASWTVDAAPAHGRGTERIRLAATMLSLAAMQIEPNLRLRVGIEWALHKRWIAIEPEGRAMIAAAICANRNHCDLPDEVKQLASKKSLDQAIGWGLAVRLCRRIGGKSRQSLQRTRLLVEDKQLVLSLDESHAALFGIPNEKDLNLLADWLGLEPAMRVEASPWVESPADAVAEG
ncbi:Ppx/GppA family phosphatase [Erythrobacter litoralis]|uniref:Exopolyphosphatase n=1 Tax=Erythrobacter litoralis (strain HTCC2594) TaxID=314225 RepID=Q2NC48_ERYLH|nr:Ppx/GppA family phosphatase [Erythrobacter litoralis]ABC62743.1 exopolyphosphatase [Erythrobacter litoralis HTCC2594]